MSVCTFVRIFKRHQMGDVYRIFISAGYPLPRFQITTQLFHDSRAFAGLLQCSSVSKFTLELWASAQSTWQPWKQEFISIIYCTVLGNHIQFSSLLNVGKDNTRKLLIYVVICIRWLYMYACCLDGLCYAERSYLKNVVCSLLDIEKWWLCGQEGCSEDPGAQPQTEVK